MRLEECHTHLRGLAFGVEVLADLEGGVVAKVIFVSHDDHAFHDIEIDVLEVGGVGDGDVGVVQAHLVELCIAPHDVAPLAMVLVMAPSATTIFAFPLLRRYWSASTHESPNGLSHVHEMQRSYVGAHALLRISAGNLRLRPRGESSIQSPLGS